MPVLSSPRVVLVYDRVNTPYGGAEKVLIALHQIFPDAPLFTSVFDSQTAQWAKVFHIVPSWLQKLPGSRQAHRWLAPLMPLAFESFDLDEFDIIISITSAEAKGVITKPQQLHLCYLLTPTRYLYSHHDEYLESLSSFTRWLAKPLLHYLRWWDEAAAFRPDIYIPISERVGERCVRYYHVEPDKVIYPPLELESIIKPVAPPISLPKKFYLVVSRLVEYKRLDLAIQACEQLGRNLVVVGSGPEAQKLQQLARDNTHFLGNVSPAELAYLYQHAQGLLMPGVEDYGITALEAVGQGVPVIIHADSGAAELITDQEEGILLPELTVAAVKAAISQLESISFDKRQMQKKMQKYATTIFCDTFKDCVMKHWNTFKRKGTL